MKKFILFYFIVQSIFGYSQITFDFQSPDTYLQTIKISNSITKYCNNYFFNPITEFNIYNLDGSIYKTILLPQKPYDTSNIHIVDFITSSLFDNDPTNIEYLAQYEVINAGSFFYLTQVIREDGTILLNEQNASPSPGPSCSSYSSVFSTEDGAKLKLWYNIAGVQYTKVFSLPGEVPTNTSNDQSGFFNAPLIYPNPNNGSFSIKPQLADGESGTMDLFSTNGRFIKSYKLSGYNNHFSEQELFEGLYLVNFRLGKKSSTSKMIIKNN